MIFLVGQEYNYLIDGGHAKYLSNIESCMGEYGVTKEHGIQLHGIIVTHPDGDHVTGITKLLEKHSRTILNDYDMVITEAFYWRAKALTKFIEQIDSVCVEEDVVKETISLRAGLNCYFPKETGHLLRCKPKDEVRCIQSSEVFLKTKPKGINANETSILTTINCNESKRKCDAVLTGDSNAKEILPFVEGKEIGIFQVPHHGSSANSRLEDKYKLEEYSRQYDFPTIHDKEVKEIFLFYSTFRAQCYLISAGGTGNYDHPHSSVLQGIILANSLRSQECVILLTNSRGLDSEKVKQLHQLVPQWTRYVKIYHYDDVFFTEQFHTSLRPEKCIRDVRTNTVEWTPEEYINRTRIMLPVKPTIGDCRPLKRNCFVEKSTVQITIQGILTFDAHIICVPLPHNPISGGSINCCYVIEESIAPGVHFSQALFLVDNDASTQSLSRAKKYILFQYINNEWQKKELPATVQDSTPQTSPCQIPDDTIGFLWPSGEEASDTTPNRRTGVLHHREKAKQQNVVMPSLVQDGRYNEDVQPKVGWDTQEKKSSTKGCNCKVLGCVDRRCGCKKIGAFCGPSCQCSDCRNYQAHTFHQPQKYQPIVSWVTEKLMKVKDTLDFPTKGCGCKTGCDTNRCGCKKQGLSCGPSCQCSGCKNYQQYAFHQPERDQPKVFWGTTESKKKVEDKMEFLTKGCGCKTGCTTNRCGCKKRESHCGPSCKCTGCGNY